MAAMSVEFAYHFHNVVPAPLRDLDDVTLAASVTSDDGDTIPAGTEGTIVSVIGQDDLYVVEFAHPEGALATVEGGDLILVKSGAR